MPNAKTARVADAARAVSSQVEQTLTSQGVPRDKAQKLARDSAVIVNALLTPDAEPYLSMMESRGCEFAPHAMPLLDILRETCHAEAPAEAWGATTRDGFRYSWEHPADRGVEVETFIEGSVETGLKMIVKAGSLDWPGSTFMAQNVTSVRATGRPGANDVADFESRKDCAWVQFRAKFTSGFESRVRIISYFDQDIQEWLPYAIAIEGIPGHVAYLLI